MYSQEVFSSPLFFLSCQYEKKYFSLLRIGGQSSNSCQTMGKMTSNTYS